MRLLHSPEEHEAGALAAALQLSQASNSLALPVGAKALQAGARRVASARQKPSALSSRQPKRFPGARPRRMVHVQYPGPAGRPKQAFPFVAAPTAAAR